MFRRLAFALAILLSLQAVPGLSAERRTGTAVSVNNASLNPANNGLVNNAKPVISAEYLDEGIGVSATESKMFVDEQNVSAAAQVSANKITYTPAAPLADGLHKIRLDIVDKAGNASTVQWSFTVHTQPPQIKILSHKQNQFINRSPVLITGSVNDSRARIVVNGMSAAVDKNTFSARVNVIEGSNTITAVATDAFGNTGSDAVVIVVDSKPPVVDITGPTAGALVNTRLVTVTGITDKNAASVSVSARAGSEGVAALLNAGAFTAKEVNLEEGVNTITVRAKSLAGNTGSASVKVTVDSIPPKLLITTPKMGSVTNRKMITVSGTVDKPTAMVKVNGTPVQVSKGMFTLSSLTLAEGNNTITATAIDRAGNQAKESVVAVLLDTLPPAAPTLNPIPPVTRTSPVIVSGSAEPGTRIELFVNSASLGTARADEKGAFSFKAGLTEGNNAISATASDGPGNASAPSAVTNVFLDTKPPRIL
jgi:hypothetical protein